MNRLLGTMMVIAALTGCTAGGIYDPASDLEAGALAAAKADGAFGAQEISLGDSATGEAGGTAMSIFALNLEEGDEVRVTLRRTEGTLNPAAYLYRGTEVSVAPDSYETADGSVTLDYDITAGGQHHIVVKAYHGEGVGGFALTTECTGGVCAGFSNDPIRRASDCIEATTQCAIADLARWNGRVGDARSRDIFNTCFDAQGTECNTSCDEEGAPVCGEVVAALPALADQSGSCRTLLTECLTDCSGMSGFYPADDIGRTAASVCWTGYNGNCAEFIAGHQTCGGTDYDAGSVGECRARCAAVEGAWDEGPWDGCTDECDVLASRHDAFILEIADEAGEYVSVDSSRAFAYVRYEEVPSEIRDRVQRRIDTFNANAVRDGRTDYAFVSDENRLSITRDGEIVGYMIGVDYGIDDVLFDGGGTNLYLNLDSDVLSDDEWWG